MAGTGINIDLPLPAMEDILQLHCLTFQKLPFDLLVFLLLHFHDKMLLICMFEIVTSLSIKR